MIDDRSAHFRGPARPKPIEPVLRPEHDASTLKALPWGGDRIEILRGGSLKVGAVGEALEFSTLEGHESRACGSLLSHVLGDSLPFVAKLIHASSPLSIQVHPEGDPSEGSIGKEEAWVVLDAPDGASVLAGVAAGVTSDQLRLAMARAIANPDEGDLLIGALNRIPVARGMVILIPTGTVHSIGPDVLIAEIQQPIDRTFRLFDYGSSRPIHPESSTAAWRIDASPTVWRPGEAMSPIEGRHITLQIWGEGEAVLPEDGVPRMLVSVGGDMSISAAGMDSIWMTHADVLLHVRQELRIRVPPTAWLVTGTVRPEMP